MPLVEELVFKGSMIEYDGNIKSSDIQPQLIFCLGLIMSVMPLPILVLLRKIKLVFGLLLTAMLMVLFVLVHTASRSTRSELLFSYNI